MTKRILRLASGIVLFAYVSGHFLNHALGLISLAAAERGLRFAVDVWQSPAGTVLLYGSVCTHIALAFGAIHQHRTLRLPAAELLRLAAGLGIPTLLIGHAVDTRLALEAYGRPTDYAHVVWMLWHSGREGRQIALLAPGWLHGCMGLRFAMRSRSWYPRWRLLLFAAALLMPVLAILGFVSMLKEVSLLAQSGNWIATTIHPIDDAHRQVLETVRDTLLGVYCGAIVAVFAARLLRSFNEERRGLLVSIGYPERTVRVPRGWTVLEASRAHRIAHVSLCGGRARCSTCRVSVIAGEDVCPPPSEEERLTLARIRAPSGTRLACQLRPSGDVTVMPLVTPAAQAEPAAAHDTVDRELTVLLVQCGWHEQECKLLPHDRLHALDRFSRTVGEIARASGGMPIEFAGNQVLVLFGLEPEADSAAEACKALLASAHLDQHLQVLGSALRRDLGCDFRHWVHVHFGPVLVGETGDRLMRSRTAMGAAVDLVRQMAAQEPASAIHRRSATQRIVLSRDVLIAAEHHEPAMQWCQGRFVGGRRVDLVRLDAVQASGLASGMPVRAAE